MTYSLNTLKNDPRASTADGDHKPTGFRRFAQEIALTAGFVFMTFWLLALLTHSSLDPAWTTSGASGTVRNFGGRLGALFGDLSFFLLGYSVWWCYAAALVAWLAAWSRAEASVIHPIDPFTLANTVAGLMRAHTVATA